jgi:uncharacterized protein (UPF0216 family)
VVKSACPCWDRGSIALDAFLEHADKLEEIFKEVFGDRWGGVVVVVLAGLLAGGLAIWVVAQFYPPAFRVGRAVAHRLRNPEGRRRVAQRAKLARYLDREITKINDAEDWRDERYTELEAEVEARGHRRYWRMLPRAIWPRSGLRRERTLAKALKRSRERLILLEGDPGSGKSVALRHVAQHLTDKAVRAKRRQNLKLPVYVNLRELRPNAAKIDADLIRTFVFEVLTKHATSDIARYLEQEFDQGMEQDRWLFLFDSFDEIPDVLSATEVDEVVQTYTDAIVDFLHGANECSGIIASREFRGPRRLRTLKWPRFRIVGLSERRRRRLIWRAELEPEQEAALEVALHDADSSIKTLAENPLFLSLMCEFVRDRNLIPTSTHEVFDAYVATRFARDARHLQTRFGISVDQVRRTAEELAFCMAAEPGLGLNPQRTSLLAAMTDQGFEADDAARTAMDALEYIRLARAADPGIGDASPPFSFSHRRFQEFFATCVVMRIPEKVPPRELMLNGMWRETAVTICQLQSGDIVGRLLEEAGSTLVEGMDRVPDRDFVEAVLAEAASPPPRRPFPWPPQALHVLGILDAGFATQDDKLPGHLRDAADALVVAGAHTGMPYDHKWALEVAGTTSERTLIWLVRSAFQRNSAWLRESAYRQVGRLRRIPENMAADIRLMLMAMSVGGQLRRQRLAITAQLKRLDHPEPFLAVKTILLGLPIVDACLHTAILACLLRVDRLSVLSAGFGVLVLLGVLSHLLVYPLRAMPPIDKSRTLFRVPLVGGRRKSQEAAVVGLVLSLAMARLVFVSASSASPVLTAAAWYAGTWSPCALWVTTTGTLTSRRWRALPQAILLLRAYGKVRAAIVGFWRGVTSFRPGAVVRIVLGSCLAALVGSVTVVAFLAAIGSVTSLLSESLAEPAKLLESLDSRLQLSQGLADLQTRLEANLEAALPKLAPEQVTRIWVAVAAAAGLVCLILVVKAARRRIRRYLLFRRWVDRLHKPIDGRRLLRYITNANEKEQLLRLLTQIQEKQLLDEHSDVFAAVNDLMLANEHFRYAASSDTRDQFQFRFEMLTRRDGAQAVLARMAATAREGFAELYEGKAVERPSGLRPWPEMECPYSERWVDTYIKRQKPEVAIFPSDVVDELSRIVESGRR